MSLDTSKNKHTRDHVGNDAGTSDQMIRRKVQMAWKQLRCAFRDIDARGEGWVTKEQLRKILTRYDIDMVDSQFDTMCAVRHQTQVHFSTAFLFSAASFPGNSVASEASSEPEDQVLA